MFKPTLALAGCFAAGSTASAQSSMTIYGILDLSVRQVNTEGVGKVRGVASGGSSASRLGFRGSEDLGGGLSAGFNLEHGLNADTGTASGGAAFFDRRATLSLVDERLGELRLGRDYTTSYMAWMRFDPFLYSNVSGSANLLSGSATGAGIGPIRAAFGPLPGGAANPNTAVRSDNTVQYHVPTRWVPGLEAQLMLAPGEGGAAASGAGKLLGLRASYAAGPLYLAAATTRTENSLTAGDVIKDTVFGASYLLGVARLSAALRTFEFRSAKQTNLLLSSIVSVGSGQIRLAWHRAGFDGTVGSTRIDANGATQWSLGYLHDLSKRTALYVQAARIENRGASTFAIPGGNVTGFLGGRSAAGIEAGIRHYF